jgi:DNA replicative helicase MCM subunit Mcm2 (Cdc46/Mcm family)
MDLQLAKHIGEVHKNKNSSSSRSDISGRTLRNYIGLAKSYEPRISEELTSMMIDRYVQRRQYYADRTKQGERYITTRNLLALIRMCQARVRLPPPRPACDSPTPSRRKTSSSARRSCWKARSTCRRRNGGS